MSHAVVRGSPTNAQLYLDSVLAELVAETGRQEDRYSIAKILYKCLRDHPQDIRQIEGSTGEKYTNYGVLQRSVRTALALQAAGVAAGQTVLLLGRNHIELTATYFGTLFAGALLFPLHMGMTAYELEHFFRISEPVFIFTEAENIANIEKALKETGRTAQIIVFGKRTGFHKSFSEFSSGFDDAISNFRPVDSDKETIVMMSSTSGSTGLPKAAMLKNRGLVAELPLIWSNNDTFPKPTALTLNSATSGWIQFTTLTLSTTAYRVPMLTTGGKAGQMALGTLRELIRKYRPTYTALASFDVASLLYNEGFQADDLSSFDLIYVGGSSISDQLLRDLRHAMRPESSALVVYGMTEMHGLFIFQRRGTNKNSLGFAPNTLFVKVMDEQGNTMGTKMPGELCLKSAESVCKGYLKDEDSEKETFTEDGWLKTGDMVYMDEQEEIHFVERLKFLIRCDSTAVLFNVYPSEVENVISKLEGVQAVAVCGTEQGPAALVVPRPGYGLIPQQVHDAVNCALSDMKRLRGGVVFTTSIPLLFNGKMNRKQLKNILKDIPDDQIHYSNNI